MRKIGIAIMLTGIGVAWMGESSAFTGIEDKLWMAAVIVGVLLMILGRLVYQYAIYLKQERARKNIRYRRYIEMQKKISA